MTRPPQPAEPSPVTVRPGPPPAESWSAPPPVGGGRLDRFAVAALVVSLPGLAPIAAVLAVIGLRRVRRPGARGRGFALAALAISAAWLVALGVAAALGVYGERKAGIGRTVAISDVRVEQCFDADLDAAVLRMVTIASCAAPHSGETYARLGAVLSGLSLAATEAAATRQCAAAFQRFVGTPYEESVLVMYYVVLEDRGVADGNILCMVGKPGDKLTGTLRGSRR